MAVVHLLVVGNPKHQATVWEMLPYIADTFIQALIYDHDACP